jgi:hypothetical protein
MSFMPQKPKFRHKYPQMQIAYYQDEKYRMEDTSLFVAWEHDKQQMLAWVHTNGSEISLTYLHPFGSIKYFMYSSLPAILWLLTLEVFSDWIQEVQCVTNVICDRESCCTTDKQEIKLRKLQTATLTNKSSHFNEELIGLWFKEQGCQVALLPFLWILY